MVEERKMKVALLGDSGVGKTSILQRLTYGTFNPSKMPTLTAMHATLKVESINKKRRIVLDIADTAGQEIYRSLAPNYYRDADAILLVYDITLRSSFDNLKFWIGEINAKARADRVLGLAGNKADCVNEETVQLQEAASFGYAYNAFFMLTSAKEGLNITDIFHTLIEKKYPGFFTTDEAFHIQQPPQPSQPAGPPILPAPSGPQTAFAPPPVAPTTTTTVTAAPTTGGTFSLESGLHGNAEKKKKKCPCLLW